MSVEITTAMKKQYSTNVALLCQQMDSRFARAVRVESIEGEYKFFDQVGQVEAQRMQTRHAPTPYVDTPHRRRRVQAFPYVVADLIDEADILRIMTDPTSVYAQAAAAAMFRAMDKEIVRAMFATSYTGKDGETGVAFDSTNMSVGVKIGSANDATDCGMNVSKLLKAAQILSHYEVPLEGRFCAMTAAQNAALLNEARTTSKDYVGTYTLADGFIKNFAGFTFVLYESLPLDSSNNVLCPFWHRDGMLLAVAKQPTTIVDRLPEHNQSHQVYTSMDMGATRMEECRVGQIVCKAA